MGEVLNEAKILHELRGEVTPEQLEYVAHRIVALTAEGLPPNLIIKELTESHKRVS